MKTNTRGLGIKVLFSAAALLIAAWLWQTEDPAELLADAGRDLRAGRFESAEQKAMRAVSHDGAQPKGFLIAGEAAARSGRFDQSAAYYRSGAECEQSPREKAQYYFFAAESYIQCGHLTDAEFLYHKALNTAPGDVLAEDRLEFLYRTEGRITESTAVLERRVALNTASFEQLLNFGHPNRQRKFPEELLKFMPQIERDVLPLLALAKESMIEGDRELAEKRLRRVVSQFPQNSDAQAELGRLLLDNNQEAFLQWYGAMPISCRDSTRIWIVRGLWAEHNSLWLEAASGFLRCLTTDPYNREATFHLAIALAQMGHHDDAAFCSEQARSLESIERTLDEIHEDRQTLSNVVKLVPLLLSVGRSAEAGNWLRLAHERFGDRPELQTVGASAAIKTAKSHVWPAMIHRIYAGKLADPVPQTMSAPTVNTQSGDSRIAFDSATSELGLTFEFLNSNVAQKPKKMFQSNGGGIGVIDVDADGWLDLYFTQGGAWPSTATSPGPNDQIFRNLGGTKFCDITTATGVIDRDFGQGVAIGDLDGDGFDEIYVANVGGNRLFRNNGDGTFHDFTVESGLAGNDWSTSCAIADFDLDGNSDLYVVNYLSLDDAATEICHENGRLRSCRSEGFVAAEDQLYLNGGDWSFADISTSSGILKSDGRGLGIIAADMDGDRYLDIFVGNDAVPNFLFLNRSDFAQSAAVNGESSLADTERMITPLRAKGQGVHFEECAVRNGIATDDAGRAQACMGIALADFNNDQKQDVFITNFYNESNTLYLGQAEGMFVDRTRSYQLAQPSLSMLGFGTQALDADLDGDDDLVVLNGHLDDLSASNVPYQMKPQVFENQAGQVFTEPELNDQFFRERHIGRSLAKFDWNGDGREDLVAGLLGASSVLLTNATQPAGSWLGLRLIGTHSARDAKGSVVTVQAGATSMSRQLTSGSGFQASNEHALRFAIVSSATNPLLDVTVRWPNGQQNSFCGVRADRNYIIVQAGPDGPVQRAPMPFND